MAGKKTISYIMPELLYSLVIVLICALVSSFVSYRVLRKEIVDLVTSNNSVIMEQYTDIIDTLVLEKSDALYVQMSNDVYRNEKMNYYMNKPLRKNIVDTLKIREYLIGIKEANPLIYSVAILYPKNNLLISNEVIRYDLFYDFWMDELNEHRDLLNLSLGKRGVFTGQVEDDDLILSRPLVAGEKTNALIVFRFSLRELRKHLNSIIPFKSGEFIVFDSDNRFLFNINNEYANSEASYEDLLIQSLNGKHGLTFDTIKFNGENSVVSVRNNAQSRFKYMLFIPINIYMEMVPYILNNLLISAIFTLFVGLLIILIKSYYFSHSVGSIIELCNAAGKKTKRPKNTYGMIQSTLSELMVTLEAKNKEFDEISYIFRENFVHWLLSEMPDNEDEIYDYMLLMKVKFPHINYCVLAMKILSDGMGSDYYEDDIKQEYVMAELEFKFNKLFNSKESFGKFINRKQENIVLGFVNSNYEENHIYELCNKLTNGSVEGFNIYICVSTITEHISHIPYSTKCAISGLKYSYIYPSRKYFNVSLIEGMEKIHPAAIQSQLNSFISWLQLKLYDKAKSELEALVNRICTQGCNIDEFETLLQIVIRDIKDNDSFDGKLKNDFKNLIVNSVDIYDLKNNLIKIIEDLEFLNSSISDSITDKLVASAKNYIEENITNPQLSLNSVAGILGVSPTYLSHVFSKREEVTFIEYITRLKMEYGRELLLETTYTLEEIAEKLNYSTAQYFISRFKKCYNTTPSVYRRRLRG